MPAGLLTVEPPMVKVVLVWLTVPELLLYEYCVADNIDAAENTTAIFQSAFM